VGRDVPGVRIDGPGAGVAAGDGDVVEQLEGCVDVAGRAALALVGSV